mmetsp:Transcript_195/g.456  ORF Transcript_195/g.456 Transcript_195/m.456 type:complete len:134 (-) Transcript_195:166-567(-)
MNSYALVLLAIIGIGHTFAFQVVVGASSRNPSPTNGVSTLLKSVEFNPIDEMCIENVAEFCLHESCDLEEYQALINQLEEQKDHFIRHTANVESLLARLKNSNHPENDPEEVKDLIASIKGTLASSSVNDINR